MATNLTQVAIFMVFATQGSSLTVSLLWFSWSLSPKFVCLFLSCNCFILTFPAEVVGSANQNRHWHIYARVYFCETCSHMKSVMLRWLGFCCVCPIRGNGRQRTLCFEKNPTITQLIITGIWPFRSSLQTGYTTKVTQTSALIGIPVEQWKPSNLVGCGCSSL